jgi:Zn-finger nucleic acid-binding protein
METLDKFGIIIDVCADHGVWLDQGEFANILDRAYRYRRESEMSPRRDLAAIGAETRATFKSSINRVAAMI